jgi:hypothetical protein
MPLMWINARVKKLRCRFKAKLRQAETLLAEEKVKDHLPPKEK